MSLSQNLIGLSNNIIIILFQGNYKFISTCLLGIVMLDETVQ